MRISVVTTALNEVEYVAKFVKRVREALKGFEYEIVFVDGGSMDGTFEVAKELCDVALRIPRASQSEGLLTGIKVASYPIVVTLDVDLENPPELIPKMLEVFEKRKLDILVASRSKLPRVGEVIASATLGKMVGIKDFFSNFRVYRRELFESYELKLGETFGGELLLAAWLRGAKIGELIYDPPPRRSRPRVGGALKANARIAKVLIKLFAFLIIEGVMKAR